MVYPALLPLMLTPRMPVVDWTDAPADLNGLVHFAERRNVVSARVPSHFKRSLPNTGRMVGLHRWSSLLSGSEEYTMPSGTYVCSSVVNLISRVTISGTRWCIYRVSQEECARLRESVPYVKVYRYNPKYLYPKLNSYGDNGQRSLKLWQLLYTYWLPNTY